MLWRVNKLSLTEQQHIQIQAHANSLSVFLSIDTLLWLKKIVHLAPRVKKNHGHTSKQLCNFSCVIFIIRLSWFCELPGNQSLCHVDRAYIEDSFNLFGIKQAFIDDYDDAMSIILEEGENLCALIL